MICPNNLYLLVSGSKIQKAGLKEDVLNELGKYTV